MGLDQELVDHVGGVVGEGFLGVVGDGMGCYCSGEFLAQELEQFLDSHKWDCRVIILISVELFRGSLEGNFVDKISKTSILLEVIYLFDSIITFS